MEELLEENYNIEYPKEWYQKNIVLVIVTLLQMYIMTFIEINKYAILLQINTISVIAYLVYDNISRHIHYTKWKNRIIVKANLNEI